MLDSISKKHIQKIKWFEWNHMQPQFKEDICIIFCQPFIFRKPACCSAKDERKVFGSLESYNLSLNEWAESNFKEIKEELVYVFDKRLKTLFLKTILSFSSSGNFFFSVNRLYPAQGICTCWCEESCAPGITSTSNNFAVNEKCTISKIY